MSVPDSPTTRHLPVVPAAAFILVWSSGYIAGPAAVDAVAPFTALGWRFGLAALIAVPLALALGRRPRMDRATLARVALVGLVMNAAQFGLLYVAFGLGLGPTAGALFHSLSPVLTVLLAALLLRERVTRVQVAGFVVGVAGVLLVLGPDLDRGGGALAVGLGALSMLTLSLGTLGQRWIGTSPDLLWSTAVQFAVSTPPLLVVGWLTEGVWPVQQPGAALVSVLWIAVVNSIVGLGLLALLVLRGGSGAAASLFFLAPPITAVLAYLVLDEALTPLQLGGLVIAVVGVGAATHSARARRPVVAR